MQQTTRCAADDKLPALLLRDVCAGRAAFFGDALPCLVML